MRIKRARYSIQNFIVGLTKLKSLQNKSVFIAFLFTEDEMVLRYISNSLKKKNYKNWFVVGEFTFMDIEFPNKIN